MMAQHTTLRFGMLKGSMRLSLLLLFVALLFALAPGLMAQDVSTAEEPLPYPITESEAQWKPNDWEFQVDYWKMTPKGSYGAGGASLDGRRFRVQQELGIKPGKGVRSAFVRRNRGWLYGGGIGYFQADGSASPTGNIEFDGTTWQSGAPISSKLKVIQYEARIGFTPTSGKDFQWDTGFVLRLQTGEFDFAGTSSGGAPATQHQEFASAGVSWICNYSWNVYGVLFGFNHEISLSPFDYPILVLARELLYSHERSGWAGRYAFGVHAGLQITDEIKIIARFNWSHTSYFGFGKNNGGTETTDWLDFAEASSGLSLAVGF